MNFSHVELDFFRAETHLLIIYSLAYGLVFVTGLVGNIFVVASVAINASMRNITNYFITSLAVADLLIIIFCLPATLMNNILTEWHMGNFLCKVSVWLNGTTSCASVYTLVAVTGDRYFAICHTLRYKRFDKRYALVSIWPIWIVSAVLFTPWFAYFHELHYQLPNSTTFAKVCFPGFPSPAVAKFLFLIANFLVAFLVPLIAICLCYGYILTAIYRHSRRALAVDRKAAERDQRIKIRVTQMMLMVIILFAASWLPLYCLYMYFNFWRVKGTKGDEIASKILRPVFQWLSLANSCVNPILYAFFSLRFRQAFHELLVLPCRRRYQSVRQFTRRIRNPSSELEPSTLSNRALLESKNGHSPKRLAKRRRVKFSRPESDIDQQRKISNYYNENYTVASTVGEESSTEMVQNSNTCDAPVTFVKIHQVSTV